MLKKRQTIKELKSRVNDPEAAKELEKRMLAKEKRKAKTNQSSVKPPRLAKNAKPKPGSKQSVATDQIGLVDGQMFAGPPNNPKPRKAKASSRKPKKAPANIIEVEELRDRKQARAQFNLKKNNWQSMVFLASQTVNKLKRKKQSAMMEKKKLLTELLKLAKDSTRC